MWVFIKVLSLVSSLLLGLRMDPIMRFDLLCLYLLRNGHDVALAPQRSLFRCRGQSCLDWLCGSAAGSVTDSVYVALLVVYHIVDAWWWLLTVPLSQARECSFPMIWWKTQSRSRISVCWLQWSSTQVSQGFGEWRAWRGMDCVLFILKKWL